MAKPWMPKTARPLEPEPEAAPAAWTPKTARPVEEEPEAQPAPEYQAADPGVGRTIGSGLLKGFFKGGSDELVGHITNAAKDVEPGHLEGWRDPKAQGGTRVLKTEEDVYRAGRDTERQVQEGAGKHRPWLSAGSEIAGDVVSDFVVKQLGIPVGGAAYRTAMGMLSGYLGSDADLTSEKRTDAEVAKAGLNTVAGGALAWGAPKVLEGVGNKALAGTRALKDFASERAVKVLGRDLDGVLNKGTEGVRKLGRDLLDSGVVRWGKGNLLGTTTEEAGERLAKLESERGHLLGGIIDTIDDKALPEDKLPVAELAARLRQKLTSGAAPAEKQVRGQLSKEIDNIEELAKPIGKRFVDGQNVGPALPDSATMGVRQFEETLKRPYQARVNWDRAGSGQAQEGLKRLSSELRKEGEDLAENIVAKRAPEMAGEFASAKERFGLASEGADIVEKQLRRNLKNRWTSPTDYAAGIAGASSAVGDAPASVQGWAMAMAHKVLRERGSSMAAVGADKIANLARTFQAIPNVFAKYGDEIGTFGARHLLRDYPGAFEALFEKEEADAPPADHR